MLPSDTSVQLKIVPELMLWNMLPHLFLHIKGRRGGQKDKWVRDCRASSGIPTSCLVFLSLLHICPSSCVLCVFISLFIHVFLSLLVALPLSLILSTATVFDTIISLVKSGPCGDTNLCPMSGFILHLFFRLSLLFSSCSPLCDRYDGYRLSIRTAL